MRALLAWLLLLTLCGLYGYQRSSEPRGVRAGEPAQAHEGSVAGRETTWRRITVGRPSGAAPVEIWSPAQDRRPAPPEPAVEVAPPPGAAPPPPEHEYTVPEGRVLSKICEQFYRTGRPPVPQRLAEYNGLGSPDDLRAGQVLKLPAWEVLFPEGRERP